MRFFFSVLGALITGGALTADASKIVSITQIVSHDTLNRVKESFIEYIKKNHDDISIVTGDAQGNISLAMQLAKSHKAKNPLLMLTISTPSTKIALKVAKGTPIVFAAITDPKAIGIATSSDDSYHNVTGVTDLPKFDEQVKFIKSILPNMKRVAVIFNPGEDNSNSSFAVFRKFAVAKGVEVVAVPLLRASDVKQAIGVIIGKVDAVYIPPDNTAASAISSIVKEALSVSIPVFAADILLVKKGCLAMIGADYNKIGTQAAKMAERIIAGENVKNIPIENPTDLSIYVNKSMAEKLGISIPNHILEKAEKVF